MILVPRQLQRAGMTGNVPYYGGRFTPEQAYAAAHPHRPRLRPVTPSFGTPTAPPPATTADPTETLAALERLRESGVITTSELEQLRARITG